MRSSAFYAVIGVGVILVAVILWWTYHVHQSVMPQSSRTSTLATTLEASTTASLTGLSIYTNGQYGFIVVYPGTDIVEKTFDTAYHLPGTWSVDALPNASGTPIVAFVGYQTSSSTTYPEYFEAEVRIGASSDPKEVSICEKPHNTETENSDVRINGTAWKAFSFENSNAAQYVKGISYRTVHDAECIALEQVESGSNNQGAPNSMDIPNSVLEQHYASLDQIVKTFSFARP